MLLGLQVRTHHRRRFNLDCHFYSLISMVSNLFCHFYSLISVVDNVSYFKPFLTLFYIYFTSMANSTSCTYINYQYQAYTCIVLWYFPENVQSFYLVCFIFLSAIWSIGPALQLQLILLHQICLSLSFNMLCMRLQTWVATAPCLFFKILLVDLMTQNFGQFAIAGWVPSYLH